jgi:hypothetical protein
VALLIGVCGRWYQHVAKCGGSYVKIKEPEGYKPRKRTKKDAHSAVPKATINTQVNPRSNSKIPTTSTTSTTTTTKANKEPITIELS